MYKSSQVESISNDFKKTKTDFEAKTNEYGGEVWQGPSYDSFSGQVGEVTGQAGSVEGQFGNLSEIATQYEVYLAALRDYINSYNYYKDHENETNPEYKGQLDIALQNMKSCINDMNKAITLAKQAADACKSVKLNTVSELKACDFVPASSTLV